jgi:hypothetical protein
MLDERRNEEALAGWEGEGGAVAGGGTSSEKHSTYYLRSGETP